jgi:hypothetical protein
LNRAIVLELRNPTDETHTFHFGEGARVGRSPSTGQQIRASAAINFTVPAQSSRWVAFSSTGNLITTHTIDDIQVIPATEIIATEGNTSIVELPNHWASANLETARNAFDMACREHMEGITEDSQRGIGGYRLMSTFSRLRSERTGRCGIYSPNALGFEYDESQESLHHHLLNDHLRLVEAYGQGYDRPDAIRLELTNTTTQPIHLRMQPGTAFEQRDKQSNQQNVVLKDEIDVTILPGESTTVTAHGMCANRTGAPPDGHLLVTPFRLMDANNIMSRRGSEQHDLWSRTDTNGRQGRM